MNVLRESKIPLYEGARTTCLVAILLLLNCFTVFGVSNACADEILKVVSELLPTGNNLPSRTTKGRSSYICWGSRTTPSMLVEMDVVSSVNNWQMHCTTLNAGKCGTHWRTTKGL